MQRAWVIISRFFLSLFICLIGVVVVGWIAEKFFFDQFYYYKSIKHGYWVPQKDNKFLDLRDFGDRASDLVDLKNYIDNPQDNVLGVTRDNLVYRIAVIGDSFVWGQGLRDKDRFVNLLKDRLNKIKPTEIVSLGGSGDSMLDNYIKYLNVTKLKHIDLVIFGMVNNDLMLKDKNFYDQTIQQQMVEACDKPIVINLPVATISPEEDMKRNFRSFSNDFGNMCIFKKTLEQIPVTNTVFFDFGPFGWQELMKIYRDVINTYGFKMLTVNASWAPILYVSKKDPHPSAYANKIFADVLYEEIIKNEYYKIN